MVKRLRYQPIIKIKGRIEVVSFGPFFNLIDLLYSSQHWKNATMVCATRISCIKLNVNEKFCLVFLATWTLILWYYLCLIHAFEKDVIFFSYRNHLVFPEIYSYTKCFFVVMFVLFFGPVVKTYKILRRLRN